MCIDICLDRRRHRQASTGSPRLRGNVAARKERHHGTSIRDSWAARWPGAPRVPDEVRVRGARWIVLVTQLRPDLPDAEGTARTVSRRGAVRSRHRACGAMGVHDHREGATCTRYMVATRAAEPATDSRRDL